MLDPAVNAFYYGVWQTLNCITVDSKGRTADHFDVFLDYLLEGAPEGATEEGLLEYFRYADEGGVVEELIFPLYPEMPNRHEQWWVLRVIDMQADLLDDARVRELKEGKS